MKKLIVFDLDGTLNQTENYAVPAMLDALKEFGVNGFTEAEVKNTIGAKDEDTSLVYFGEAAEHMAGAFWDRVHEYTEKKYFNCYRPYEGTEKMLAWLKKEGYTTAVCSNADIDYIETTLNRLGIRQYFDDLQPVIPGKTKADSLKCLLGRHEPEEALMMGDRYFDLEAARGNGIPFIGCLYGYGDREELDGAAAYLNCPQDLILYLMRTDHPPVRVVVLDLDGTLTDSQKRVSPRTKQALFRFMEQGGTVVLASGRPTYGITPVMKELEMEQRGGYILSYNGGCITECRTGKVVYQKVLKQDQVMALSRQSRACRVNILTYDRDQIITEHASDIYAKKESAITRMAVKRVDSFEDYVGFPVVKCLMTAEAGHLEKVENEMKQYWKDNLSISRSEPFFLEVTAAGIDKAKSLKRLFKLLGISASEAAAFGDGFNDRSMIELAGFGVAMDNAQNVVKETADYVAPSNDKEGVADTLERLFGWGAAVH